MNDGDCRLLAAAQGGDEQAFVQLTAPHRRVLHLLAYRMLGSLHDADDVVQEAMLRAWRALPKYEPRAALSTWLHRITVNVALRMLERRPADVDGVPYLQPYPDRFLEEIEATDPTPDAAAIARESIGLAYIAAMQLLPAKQRTVLVLRDGLSWPTGEIAELLGETPAAVNSALQRARDRLAREHDEGRLARAHRPASAAAERAVIDEFLDAWAAVDVPRLVALLADDAILTMPPMALRFEGRYAIGRFFATEPAGGDLAKIRHVESRANGQPGLSSYIDGEAPGTHDAYGVMIFAVDGEHITSITGFPHDLEVFRALGLPETMAS